MARFLSLVGAEDATRVRSAALRDATVVQLLRAVDSISANIAEGYSRFSGRERARFYEIALGSAREAREWYAR
ncbi:MAG: four helix bundle protein, partial [Cytophagaceae bacterium]|nr:four helix bundle protein [Gemmatimonadaceae bacterium]